jgi:hypothetical protein
MTTPNRTTPFEIRNHAALASFAKRFAPTVNQADEAPVPPTEVDYYKFMNMPQNVELSDSEPYTIDVQNDFRYIFAFIAFHVTALYPEANVKGHPAISPPSLIAYCLAIVYAHILTCDLSSRRTCSDYANVFRNDNHLKDYLSTLLNANIPPFLMPLLSQLAPTTDPRRTLIEYVPSLAGFSFIHDFGRTIPIHALLAAHQLVATSRSNLDPADVLLKLYKTELITVNTTPYRIGNLFGTHYNNQVHNFTHSNWLNLILESVFNPIVGRALTQKPTFSRIPIHSYTVPDPDDVNPYIYALSATDDNLDVVSDFIRSASRFTKAETSNSIVLGQLLQSITGITILTHSVEPPTLPTWTHLEISADAIPTHEATHINFASHTRFLSRPTALTGTITYPPDLGTTPQTLLLMTDVDADPNNYPVEFLTFDGKIHISPQVLYFQPYDVSPSALAHTITLGLKIESSEIDGITVPTEHPTQSLSDNNSMLLQSAIRLDKIARTNMTADPTIIRSRTLLDASNQPLGLAISNMSINVLPSFVKTQVPTVFPSTLPGFTSVAQHTDPKFAFNYSASKVNNPGTLPDQFIHLWSSYRYVSRLKRPTATEKFMFSSFRPIYGTNVTLSRSRNPNLIIPK